MTLSKTQIKENQHPWQNGPTELIVHAIEHYQRETESDNRTAYLLVDVGVETLFKTYLTLPDDIIQSQIKRNERLQAAEGNFHELLRTIQKSNPKKAENFNFAHFVHYHDLRNALYHQGNRVTAVPTDTLKKYLFLAKDLLKEYLEVELGDINPQKKVTPQPQNEITSQLESITDNLMYGRRNIASLEANSALLTEHLYPQLAARKIEARLRRIRAELGPDDESYPPAGRADLSQKRIDAFNEITSWDFTEYDYELVEYLIDNPEWLHVWLAFEEISDNHWKQDWQEFRSAVNFMQFNLHKIKNDDEVHKYEEVSQWLGEKAEALFKWVKMNIPGVEPKEYYKFFQF